MISASSSASSTLSPLAPPFTVDLHQPYRYPPQSIPPLAEFDGDGVFDSDGSNNSLSSWIDPSLSYNASPINKGGAAQSSVAYGDAYGSWYGKHVDSSARQVHIGADSSARQERDENRTIYMEKSMDSRNNGMSYFQLPNPNLGISDYDMSSSTPSYDRYMSQLVSCSPDSIVYYPSTTCSSTTPRNGYSTTPHGILLYNIDDNYVDCMLHNKEPGLNGYSGGKEDNVKESIVDKKIEGSNRTWNSPKATACSSSENKVKTENSLEYSAELKYGVRAKQLNFTHPFASSSGPGSSFQTSSDILDQPNLSVDSPCWKGASVSQKYLFSGGEMIDCHHEVKESNGSYDLNWGQKCLPVTAQFLSTLPYEEKYGSPVCHGSTKFSPASRGDVSPCISLYETERQFHDSNAKGSESTEEREEKRCHISCVHSEKNNDVKSSENDYAYVKLNVDQERTTSLSFNGPGPVLNLEGSQLGATHGNATQDKSSGLKLVVEDHLRNFSLPGVVFGEIAKPINSVDPSATYLTAGNDIRLIVKAMHGLSEVLLSSSYNGVRDWMEYDDELVQHVIGNLETFISRSKTGNAPDRSPVSKSNDMVKKQSNTSTQVSVHDLETRVFEEKEYNPQAAVLYKNLWMQAEAAMCSMKYELQLARLKLEVENNLRHETKAEESVQVMPSSSRLNSMQCFDQPAFTNPPSFYSAHDHISIHCPTENDAGKSGELELREQNTFKDRKFEASVMDRLEVLRGRYAKSNDASMEEQPKCHDAKQTFEDLSARLDDLGFVESKSAQLRARAGAQHGVLNSPGPEISEYGCDSPLSQTFLASMDGQRNPMRLILG